MESMHPVHSFGIGPWSSRQSLGYAYPSTGAPLREPGPLFVLPSDVLEAVLQLQVEPAAGTCGFLAVALERLQEPVLVNPPFALRVEG